MPEFRSDSYCGLYCGACDILVAYKKGIETGTSPEWSGMPSEFSKLPLAFTNAEIKCHGCKSDIVFVGCSKCIIRRCAIKKTGIETCLDCRRYPCWRHKMTAVFKRLFKVEEKLPHQKAIRPNLEAIRNKGLSVWLEEQGQKWQCQHCGKRLSWYNASCNDCSAQTKE